MDKTKQKELFEALKKRMLQVTNMVELSDSENLRLTSAFTTLKNPEELGNVLYEMQYMEMFQGTTQIEIDMTLDIDFKSEGVIKELEKAIMNLNFFLPMGAFGISYQSNRIFNRYTIYLDESKDIDALALYVYQVCELLGGVIGSVFLPLKAIATEEMTFEEAVEKKLLIKQ